jgi:hypothetical protein
MNASSASRQQRTGRAVRDPPPGRLEAAAVKDVRDQMVFYGVA